MSQIVLVNPFRCRVWELHDRLDTYVTEETCKLEIRSFDQFGQLVPTIGRTICGDPDHEIEIICGVRRLFIARTLNMNLQVELRKLSDIEAVIAMDIENRHRLDISPYERGLSYARWIRNGYFRSQTDISRALKISASQVSRLLKIATLPCIVVNAFDSPQNICEMWGLALIDALEDPKRRNQILNRARSLSGRPRLAPSETYRQLINASTKATKLKSQRRDEIVRNPDGRTIFRIRHQRRSICILLPIDRISTLSLPTISKSISGILQTEASRLQESSKSSINRPEAISESGDAQA